MGSVQPVHALRRYPKRRSTTAAALGAWAASRFQLGLTRAEIGLCALYIRVCRILEIKYGSGGRGCGSRQACPASSRDERTQSEVNRMINSVNSDHFVRAQRRNRRGESDAR